MAPDDRLYIIPNLQRGREEITVVIPTVSQRG